MEKKNNFFFITKKEERSYRTTKQSRQLIRIGVERKKNIQFESLVILYNCINAHDTTNSSSTILFSKSFNSYIEKI